jgi:hypothetical protein
MNASELIQGAIVWFKSPCDPAYFIRGVIEQENRFVEMYDGFDIADWDHGIIYYNVQAREIIATDFEVSRAVDDLIRKNIS